MEKTFILGIAIGMVGGALLAVNSKKVKELVQKGEKEMKKKLTASGNEKSAENGEKSESEEKTADKANKKAKKTA